MSPMTASWFILVWRRETHETLVAVRELRTINYPHLTRWTAPVPRAILGSGALEVAIVHHTDCGASRFADPQVRQRLGQSAGTGEAAIERLAISDPQTSVAEDLDRLRAAPTLPDELVVAGYVYNVTDGQVREIFAPASLRAGARS